MGNAPDMSSSFAKVAGGVLIFAGISLFAISGGAAIAAGAGFKTFAADAAISAMAIAGGYVMTKGPDWAATP